MSVEVHLEVISYKRDGKTYLLSMPSDHAEWAEQMLGLDLAAHDAEVAAKAYERAILDVGLNPDLANQLLDTNPYRKAVA